MAPSSRSSTSSVRPDRVWISSSSSATRAWRVSRSRRQFGQAGRRLGGRIVGARQGNRGFFQDGKGRFEPGPG